jgi:hypothetical protein
MLPACWPRTAPVGSGPHAPAAVNVGLDGARGLPAVDAGGVALVPDRGAVGPCTVPARVSDAGSMTVNYSRPGVSGRAAQAEPGPPGAVQQRHELLSVDWRAARHASRACCCPARPVVVAVIPPAPGRPRPTDLLLCGHHYRVARPALTVADAMVLDLDGVPVTGPAWQLVRAGR